MSGDEVVRLEDLELRSLASCDSFLFRKVCCGYIAYRLHPHNLRPQDEQSSNIRIHPPLLHPLSGNVAIRNAEDKSVTPKRLLGRCSRQEGAPLPNRDTEDKQRELEVRNG